MTKDELELLRSYKNGPRVWDAWAILPRVWALAGKGLLEPSGDPDLGVYKLTGAGHKALDEASSTREGT